MDRRLDVTTAAPSELAACEYCGAALSRLYYFCTSCSAPYRRHDAVVPRARPEPKSARVLVREQAPDAWPLFWTYACVLLVGSVVAHLAWGADHPQWVLFFLDGAIGVTTVYFASVHWSALRPQLARLGFDRWEAWAGLGALVPLLALNIGYHEWLGSLLGIDGGAWITSLRDAGLTKTTLVFFICVFPAVSEEIAFRGLLQHWLTPAIGARKALLLAAALFTAMHMSVLSVPTLFLAGVLFGWVKQRTGSLYPSMLIHGLHNWAVLAYVGV